MLRFCGSRPGRNDPSTLRYSSDCRTAGQRGEDYVPQQAQRPVANRPEHAVGRSEIKAKLITK
jgi:hypothetical protein